MTYLFLCLISILPQPVSLEMREGSFVLKPNTAIATTRETRSIGEFLSRALAPTTRFVLPVRSGAGKANSIEIALDRSLDRLGDEGYTLEVTPERIAIRAPKAAGAFYAVQSLRQLLPAADAQRIPCVRIEDHPRFAWRGALVDVARHYMPKPALLKFIDQIALLKMNSLQLHLTDDQGWRVQIAKYPRLTKVGSIRKETRLGHERRGKEFDGKPHGGFYTQADIKEIVAYGRRNFVNVVPEIEMPGHAQAAIAAYPELGNTGKPLEVLTHWGVNKNVFNVNEKTILFLQDVLSEVLKLFPSKFIHVGGDEVPLDQWKASADAKARMKELGLTSEVQLHGYFIRRMDEFLAKRGRRLVGWDEILEGGVNPTATVMSWRGNKGGIKAAKAGHDVVMADNTRTYFDYYQSKDPKEPLAIGGFLPLDMVYSFEPVPAELTAEEGKHILGTQGQLWTEYIATPEYLEYMAFPRMAALAEVAWTAAAQKNYSSFLERLRTQEERWKTAGVNFRPVER